MADPVRDPGSYDPEIERYGGPVGLEACEALFCADSDAVLQLLMLEADLQMRNNGQLSQDRWKLALASLHKTLEDFQVEPDQRMALLSAAVRQRLHALGIAGMPHESKRWKSTLSQLARREKSVVSEVTGQGRNTGGLEQEVSQILRTRSHACAVHVARLRNGGLQRPVDDILLSILHMNLNRLMSYRQIEIEAVLFELLTRGYRAERARSLTAT